MLNEKVVPNDFYKTLTDVPSDMLRLSEQELIERLAPDNEMRRLRTAFWTEHDRAVGKDRIMDLEHVIRGRFRELDDFKRHLGVIGGEVPDCDDECQFFDGKCITHDFQRKQILYRRAYYSLPIPTYEHVCEEFIAHSLQRVRAILDLPFTDPMTGKVNTQQAKVVLEATKFMFERVFGMPKETMVQLQIPGMPGFKSQVSEQKQISMSPEEIDAQIKELEAKTRGRG